HQQDDLASAVAGAYVAVGGGGTVQRVGGPHVEAEAALLEVTGGFGDAGRRPLVRGQADAEFLRPIVLDESDDAASVLHEIERHGEGVAASAVEGGVHTLGSHGPHALLQTLAVGDG